MPFCTTLYFHYICLIKGPILHNLPHVIYHLTINDTSGDVEIYVLVVSVGCRRPNCKVNNVYPDGVFWITGKTHALSSKPCLRQSVILFREIYIVVAVVS